MKILVLTTSLNARSRCRALAEHAKEVCEGGGAEVCLVDLHEMDLPMCGATGADEYPQVVQLTERVREADGILIATPIHNYAVSAACKNVIELTGEGWENKIVGFMCAAGGQSSYMAVMPLASSLMLDFRCLIVPRFVYTTGTAVRDGRIVDAEIARRVQQLCHAVMGLAEVWRPVP